MSKKRGREQSNVDVQAVEIFEDLANDDEEIRLAAARLLLSRTSPEKLPARDELDKVLKRLIRGLCSGRKAVRLGFSVALTEFLSQHVATSATFTVPDILDVLEDQTKIAGKGQEERDHYFGRLFGLEAVIKSGITFQPPRDGAVWNRVLEIVFALAKKKSWLREECGWLLHGALQCLDAENAGHVYAEALLQQCESSGLAKTPEGLALWIVATTKFPGMQAPSHTWHKANPLHRKERSAVARVLKETSSTEMDRTGNAKGTSAGNWSSRLHFAWEVVFGALDDKPKRITFSDLWTEAVDDGLFASSSSSERKYRGFLLFQRCISFVPLGKVDVVFSKNFLRCLINQLSSNDRYLHGIAEKSLQAVHARAKKEPQIISPVLTRLLSDHDYVAFDSLTKTKTFEKLLAQADLSTLRSIVKFLEDLIMHPRSSDEGTISLTRQVAADLMLGVIRSRPYPAMSDPDLSAFRETYLMILQIFVQVIYLVAVGEGSKSDSKRTPLSDRDRELYKSKLTSCLTQLTGKDHDASYYPYHVVSMIAAPNKSDAAGQSLLTLEMDSDIQKSIAKAIRTLEKLGSNRSSDESTKAQYEAFKLLYSLTLLQVYNGDADSVNILDELQDCTKGLLKNKSTKGKAEASEILVEILLSFVSKPSVLFRKLGQQVFSAVASSISAAGLQSMLKILQTKEDASGQDAIFDREEEDDASDVEMQDPNDSGDDAVDGSEGHSEEGSDTSSTAQDGGGSSESGDDAEELAAFDAKLALALGTRRADDDLAVKEDESSDSDMDDDQMEAMDVHLEQVFKERKKVLQVSKKKERKDAKETILNFKRRVLDLLEIYIKQQHLNPLALDVLPPLLSLIYHSTDKPMIGKASSIIREFSKLYKIRRPVEAQADGREGAGKHQHDGNGYEDDGSTAATVEHARSLLDGVHEAAMTEGPNAHEAACSQASLLLAKVITNAGGFTDVMARYSRTQELFVQDAGCKVRTAFFTDWLNWCTSARGALAA